MTRLGLPKGSQGLPQSIKDAAPAPVDVRPSTAVPQSPGLPDLPPVTSTARAASARPGNTASSAAQFAGGLFRRFAKPVAAVMLGAASLPALAGAAMAEPFAAHEIRYEAPAPSVIASIAAPASGSILAGQVDAGHLFENHLQQRLHDIAERHALYAAQAPSSPIVRTDLLKLADVVSKVDTLIREDGALPANLLADLDHLLDALADAKPGQFARTVDLALKDLPSTRFEVPGLDAAHVDGRAPTLGSTGRITGPGDGWLRDLLNASPTDFPEQAQSVLQQYSAVMAGMDAAFSGLPNFSIVSQAPFVYDSGDGVLFVPPGATLSMDDGQFSIAAPGMLWSQDGLTVVADDGVIRLGSDLDGLQAGQVSAAGEDWMANLEGATLGVNRDDGFGIIRADRADLDLDGRAMHLEGAQLVVGADGASALDAGHIQVADDGFDLDLRGVGLEQTRTGTSGTLDSARYVGDGTVLEGESLDVRFGPGGAHIEAGQLDVVSGATRLALEDAVVDMTPRADGGHDIAFTGTSVGLGDGNSRLDIGGGTQGSLQLGPDGVLQRASFTAGEIGLQTTDGAASVVNGGVDVRVGPGGYLSAATLRADQIDFDGRDFDVSATGGRLDASFGPQGHLTRIATRADAAQVSTADGTFGVQGGVLDARFSQGRLQTAAAELGAAHWQGADGATVDAENSRFRVGFHEGGGLSEVALAAGKLDARTADGKQVSLTDGRGRLEVAPDGALRAAHLSGGRLQLSDAAQRLDLRGLDAHATFDEGGLLESATARAARVEYQHGDGTYLATGAVALDATLDGGHLTGLGVRGDQIRYAGELGNITAASGALDATFTPDGKPASLRFDTRDLSASGAFGRLDVRGAGHLDARWSDAGDLEGLRAHADQLDFADAGRTLSVTDGDLEVSLAGDRVQSATATFEAASYAGDFGRLALTGGTELGITYGDDGAATVRGFAQHLDLAHDGGRLNLDGGRVQGQFGPDGLTERLSMSADHLGYAGTGDGDHPLAIDVANPQAVLTALDDGGQRLEIGTGSGSFDVDGHHVGLDGVQQLTLETNAQGEVDGFFADFDGRIEFLQDGGDLSLVAQDVEAGYQRDASRLTLDFGELDVALRGEGLQARVEGGHALLDEHQLFVRVDRAELLRDLGAQLDVEVEDLTLHVARGAQGNLQELDLQLGALDANIDGMDLMVRTPAGERVRLNVKTDEDGQLIKQAYLQIPEGGEVRIQRDDLDLSLGGQVLRFTHGDDGVYRFRGESLDIAASTKDATVRVEGGDAQVSMDPATGRLVIDEITGTSIDLSTKDADVHVDIDELRGFMARMTKLEGGATGAALHLVPTEDGSTMTVRATADIGGIPVELSFTDVHELEALGQISENQVHVFARDPSGRGDIRIGVGPVELQGSAIELVGRYHAYDAGRMTEGLHKFVTTGGQGAFSGIGLDDDGVFRFGTDREGVNAELAVILPRGYEQPGYRFDMGAAPPAAPGVIGSLGYRADDVTVSMFAGVMPGSQATLHVKEGDLSIGGFELPDRTALPTTGVAGLRLDLADVDGGHLGVVGGGFVNPAGLVDSPFVDETSPYGALMGLEYGKDNWAVSASGTLDFDGRGNVGGKAVMLRLGISF